MSSDVAEPSVGTCIFIIPLFHNTEMNNTPTLSVRSHNERKGTLSSISPMGFSSVRLLKMLAAQESRTEQLIGSHKLLWCQEHRFCLLLTMKLWFIFNFLKVWLYTCCRTRREAASPHNRKRCTLLHFVKNPSPLCLARRHLKHILRNVKNQFQWLMELSDHGALQLRVSINFSHVLTAREERDTKLSWCRSNCKESMRYHRLDTQRSL